MSEPDYHGLRDQLEAAAPQPDFSFIERRSRRHVARRRLLVPAVAAAVAAVLVTAGATLPRLAASIQPGGAGVGSIRWADGGDSTHLYAMTSPSGSNCKPCRAQLWASTDGGRTWDPRREFTLPSAPHELEITSPAMPLPPENLANQRAGFLLQVLGPKIVVVAQRFGGGERSAAVVTADGGVTWRDVTFSDQPVTEARRDVRPLDCAWLPGDDCTLHVLDPGTGRARPLASQPPLTHRHLVRTPAAAGIWMEGYDPQSGHRAVSVSRDRGRTWRTALFRQDPPIDSNRGDLGLPHVATTDGRTAYASFGLGPLHVFRSTDGGATWHPTGGEAPNVMVKEMESLVTADGGHVVSVAVPERAPTGFVSSKDGNAYQWLEIGSPGVSRVPRALSADRFLAYDSTQLYLSDDGWTWRPVPLR